MESKKIPPFVLWVVSKLYRFVMGAFGVDLPSPLNTTFCLPFWITLAGVTVGLPIVFLGWFLRLFFGKKYAASLGRVILSNVGRFVFIGLVVLLLLCSAIAGIVGLILGKDWLAELGYLAALAGAIIGAFTVVLLGLTLCLCVGDSHLWQSFYRLIDRIFSTVFGRIGAGLLGVPMPSLPGEKIAHAILLILVLPVLIPMAILCGLAFAMHALYKRYCPLVRLP